MPAINYDLPDVLFSKDNNSFLVTVTDENLAPVDLTGGTASFAITNHAGTRVVFKSGIAVSDQEATPGQVTIDLTGTDTTGLAGRYMYECVVILDTARSTVVYGEITFRETRAV